jgi:hypothetical protein
MAGPRRTTGETIPLDKEELGRLAKKSATQAPAVRPNANVVASKRGASTKVPVASAPPPPGEDEVVVVVEMDDDDEPAPRRARSDTVPDPTTMSILAEIARGDSGPPPAAPRPPAADGPNRHVKRRGG